MFFKRKQPVKPMNSDPQPQTDPAAGAADAAAAGATENVTIPAAELEALRQEVREWKERCQRGQAEFDNVRKRLRKEADEAGNRAVARFVRPLLTEFDNLERALLAATPEAFNEFAQGVTMIRANLASTLTAAGIELVAHEGKFDPAVHEVLGEVESAEHPHGHIVQVHRLGYRFKDQLVRTAQVSVAKPPADAK